MSSHPPPNPPQPLRPTTRLETLLTFQEILSIFTDVGKVLEELGNRLLDDDDGAMVKDEDREVLNDDEGERRR